MTCVICDKRPAVNGGGFCANCKAKLEAQKRQSGQKPFRYATYQGHVIVFYHDGGGELTYKPVQRKPENLPKGITINLNTYCEGFTREQVKKLKAAILSEAAV